MSQAVTPIQQTGFQIDPQFRQLLNELAPKYYHAKEKGNDDKASDLFKELYSGLSALGSGAGRIVIPLEEWNFSGGEYDEYVVKLAIPHERTPRFDGLEQNACETQLWEETQSEYLAPVVESGPNGYWIVMPRGEDLDGNHPNFWSWIEQADYVHSGDDIWRPDVNKRNTVQIDGEYYLCDYGVPPK